MARKPNLSENQPKSSKRRMVGSPTSHERKTKPLLSVRQPPAFNFTESKNETQNVDSKSTRAANEVPSTIDDQLWIDRYAPESEGELVVHKRKVEDVRRWLQEAFDGGPAEKLKKYRRILVLTGPAGAAKTTTVRILAKEMGFDISEWRASLEESYVEDDYERESLSTKLEAFLARAGVCRTLSGANPTSAGPSNYGHGSTKKQIILLEDLPNILHQSTQASFHSALESFLDGAPGVPLIIIISDVSTRGEAKDERLAEGANYSSTRDTVNIRTVLPPTIINGPFVMQISFNPIAPTLMHRALQALLAKHAATTHDSRDKLVLKEELNLIVETSNGDIKSAIMALQFACVLDASWKLGKNQKGKKTRTSPSARTLIESITRREQSLALFHMIGKILYNKRKGDPPSSSSSAKEKVREQELDSRVKIPPPLPPWFSIHERRPSRIDVENLYADSPVDTGLFALYIHQNYTQFCNEIEECDALNDWLSWIDCSGGEKWYQANPHQFHLLTLGALHALPSPVSRRGQKLYKPDFFDTLKRSQEAYDAVGDVQTWMRESTGLQYDRSVVALEMGAVLKAKSRTGCKLPSTHHAFTSLAFSRGTDTDAGALEEDGSAIFEPEFAGDDEASHRAAANRDTEICGSWLEDDDIDEF